MAASDKNTKGKRSDFAKHYSGFESGPPACDQRDYGYSTNIIEDVDCKKCLSKIHRGLKFYN